MFAHLIPQILRLGLFRCFVCGADMLNDVASTAPCGTSRAETAGDRDKSRATGAAQKEHRLRRKIKTKKIARESERAEHDGAWHGPDACEWRCEFNCISTSGEREQRECNRDVHPRPA